MLLNNEELMEMVDTIRNIPFFEADDIYLARTIAEAQLKKVVEWGDESCLHYQILKTFPHKRRQGCPQCWQALLEEVEE